MRRRAGATSINAKKQRVDGYAKKESNLCNSSPSALPIQKPLAAERSEIGDRRKRGGKTVLAKGPTTVDAAWEFERLYGYASIRRVRCRKHG
jgi:hypothetical protein